MSTFSTATNESRKRIGTVCRVRRVCRAGRVYRVTAATLVPLVAFTTGWSWAQRAQAQGRDESNVSVQDSSADVARSVSLAGGDNAAQAPVGTARASQPEASQPMTSAPHAGTSDRLMSTSSSSLATSSSSTDVFDLRTGGAEPVSGPAAQTESAVAPQSISLPDAEGSVEGMGESFAPVLSSGTATFNVPIALPPGRAGVQPTLALSYASTGGNSCVGIGWNLGVPFISRQTDRGLPRHQDEPVWHEEEDRFLYNGGQELVPVDSAAMARVDESGFGYPAAAMLADVQGWQQYRARVEGGFMRFFRAPDARRWVVQGKDGTRFDFGLLPEGEGPADLDARAALESEFDRGEGRIFRWHLTRMSDPHGSAVYYRYFESEGERYLAEAYYLSPASCAGPSPAAQRACTAPLAQYGARVQLAYEGREDVFDSYLPGWRRSKALRLHRITVSAAEEELGARFLVRRYHLRYDPLSFHSLLASVQVEGRPDRVDGASEVFVATRLPESALGDAIVGRLLPAMTFEYSRMPTGGPSIAGFGGVDNAVRNVAASPSVSVDSARTGLFDVNSDGLPDVVVTDPARYRTSRGAPAVGVFFNGFAGEGAEPAGQGATFSAPVPMPMDPGLADILSFDNPNIVGMDVEGDGRSDFLHIPRLDRYGWFTPTRAAEEEIAAVSPRAQGWRWTYARVSLDQLGSDPRIDLARDASHYQVWDVNNDHLIDVVRTTGTGMQTWLNLGWVPGGEGRFGQARWDGAAWRLSADPIETCLLQDGTPIDFADSEVRLADMNGDGVQDIVRLRRGRLVYWPGRGDALWGVGPSSCARGQGAGRAVAMRRAPPELNPELSHVFLSDINMDGAADVIQVRFRELDVWFNEAGRGFTSRITVSSPFAPDFSPRIRFADLDGSSTTDLIYGNAGRWQYLDLAGGRRPRLLTAVQNGLGALTTIEYGSSADDYLADLEDASSCQSSDCDRFTWSRVRGECDSLLEDRAGECAYRSGGSPVISSVVRAVTTNDQFGQLNSGGRSGGQVDNRVRTEFAYHDGYYEGIEQEFRGFGAADARAIGDANHPTQWTRTRFHQGRRPNQIATDRLAENPNEALKGRTWLTETFDDAGRYLSTAHAACTVRQLATGLDGRFISYAFVSQTDEFRYDVAGFAPGGGAQELPWLRFEAVPPGGGAAAAELETTNMAIVRGARWAWTRTTTDLVDNLGHVRRQTAHGRLKDERDSGPRAYSEEIVSHTEPVLLNDGGRWIWRTASSFVTGHGSAERLGEQAQQYDPQTGDALYAVNTARAPQTFDFGGDDAGAASLAQPAVMPLESSSRYDSWGNAVASCAGADLRLGASGCLRFAEVAYDPAYAHLPLRESTAVGQGAQDFCDRGTSGAFCMLTTSAAWDRGFGVLLSATDANQQTTRVGYDGLARLTFLAPPRVAACDMGDKPTHRFYYELVPNGLPVSFVRSVQNEGNDDCSADELIQSYAYVDGLGRARATMTRAENSSWEQSGVQLYSARGTPVRTFNNQQYGDIAGEHTPLEAVAVPAQPYVDMAYDAFGREVRGVERDGSVSRTFYRALSTDVCDPLDLQAGSLFGGTCTTTRVDGHGRTVDQVLRQRTPERTDTEYHRLFSTYRADNAVVRLTRAQTASDGVGAPPVADGSGRPRVLNRTFFYDSQGRRLASTDPDTDSPSSGATWRYLFNTVSDLVAVRDPRGCGQNLYYDHSGRPIGEDYVQCAESQSAGDEPDESVPADAIGLGLIGVEQRVDARYYFDAPPPWASALPAQPASFDRGRPTASSDRGQRTRIIYDQRGQAIQSARQMAMIPAAGEAPETLTDPPAIVGDQPPPAGTRAFDEAHTYVSRTRYDHIGRPVSMELPPDPDWETLGGTGPAPVLSASLIYNRRMLPARTVLTISAGDASVADYPIIRRQTYSADRLPVRTEYGLADTTGVPFAVRNYDARLRPVRHRAERTPTCVRGATATPELCGVTTLHDYRYQWDTASNLKRTLDARPAEEWPAGHRPAEQLVQHDALYRVIGVHTRYAQEDGAYLEADEATDWRAERTRMNDDGEDHLARDPMRRKPAPMLPALPDSRVVDLVYTYDWLSNMVEWTDDAQSFYERALGPDLGNGFGNTSAGGDLRPSALYFASNIRAADGAGDMDPDLDRGGWVSLNYGEGGNAVSMTVHAQCRDRSETACADPQAGTYQDRDQTLRANCRCANEQHYQYRWDELNRLSEARRYDRMNAGGASAEWQLAVRQRYRYDAGNVRTHKQTRDQNPDGDDPPQAIALYIYPGDYERRGLTQNPAQTTYQASSTLGTETQYLLAGARIVWNPGTPAAGLDRNHRITTNLGDLLGTTTAVADLASGELLETATYYPNGARETHLTTQEQSYQLEPIGFTGKEADEEVGLVYFGERYLIPRIGRWASPDPLHVHAAGGGEALNSYHYVSGNLLQAVDPLGLDAVDDAVPVRSGVDGMQPDQVFAVMPGAETPNSIPSMSRDQLNNLADQGATLFKHSPDAPMSLEDALTLELKQRGAAADFANLMSTISGFGNELSGTDPNGINGGRCTSCAASTAKNIMVGVAGAALFLIPIALEGIAGARAAAGPNLGNFADELALASSSADDAANAATHVASGGGAALEARAGEVHSVLDPIAARQRTTAVLRTSGEDIVAGGARDLNPAQRAALRPGETAARLPGAHAEVTALRAAEGSGVTPRAMGVSRRICPNCQTAIEESGGRLTSPTTATWE